MEMIVRRYVIGRDVMHMVKGNIDTDGGYQVPDKLNSRPDESFHDLLLLGLNTGRGLLVDSILVL
jgi:hypothetical protein